MQALINSVKGNGVDDKDVQSTQLNISPEYDNSIVRRQRSSATG